MDVLKPRWKCPDGSEGAGINDVDALFSCYDKLILFDGEDSERMNGTVDIHDMHLAILLADHQLTSVADRIECSFLINIYIAEIKTLLLYTVLVFRLSLTFV